MPPAAASFDDAFDFDEPARKRARKPRAAAQKGGARKKGKKSRRFAVDPQKIARYGAIGMSATIALAIMVNALVLQKGHHPAPLFGKSIALGATPVPAKAPAPERHAAADPAQTTVPSQLASSQLPPSAPAAEPATSSTEDPIGRLIEGHEPPPAPSRTDSRTVIGAQRALAKLGFALKPSGTLGPQTRKAIEAFERDRHLPVKGELTHRLVKILAAESGVKIVD